MNKNKLLALPEINLAMNKNKVIPLFWLCLWFSMAALALPGKAYAQIDIPTVEAKNSAPKINVLLVTGRSNKYHNWKGTSVAIENHLRRSGVFSVDKYVSSPAGEPIDDFNPKWKDYDVVVLDYEGEEWPKRAKRAFEKYVKKGGGVVLLHASDNAFPQWPEYNKIIGLGGWGGSGLHDPVLSPGDAEKKKNRDERWGPRVFWQHGRMVKEDSPGGTFHPPQHDYLITVRNYEHPITRDLPEMWMQTGDELYSRLRGPAENLDILATGFANPAMPYTSPHNEPVLFTVRYGEGRVFHSVLGHVGAYQDELAPSVNNVSFITTLLRGTEWAATGDVIQIVPDQFPTAYDSVLSEENAKDWQPLLDPELSHWEIYVGVPEPSVSHVDASYAENKQAIGLHKNPNNLFSTYVQNEETVLHISGEIYAGLTSKASFENYHFQTKVRWGDKKWPPRLDKKRDSGILYHAYGEHGAFWDVWKSSLEFQIQERDFGDFIDVAGPTATIRFSEQGERSVYDVRQPFREWNGYLHAQVEVDRPHGEWNVMDLYVVGDRAIHVANGKVVMVLKNAVDGDGQPLVRGQLQIQSEGAEVEYAGMRIRPIKAFPAMLERKAKFED